MLLLKLTREQISSEFSFLLEHYADDYEQLRAMYQIANDLIYVRDAQFLAKAYRTLISKLTLIQRYDVEFKYASLQLYELLSYAIDVESAE